MNRINLTESEIKAQVARIQREYDYDADAGLLVNKRRGKAVKGVKHTGTKYWRFGFRNKGKMKFLLYHGAVWAWHHGRLPKGQIDHIDGDEQNNRIENLREVNGHENQMNTLHDWQPNEVTGLPGVSPDKGLYQTKIHGKNCRFADPCMAFYHATMCGKRYRLSEK